MWTTDATIFLMLARKLLLETAGFGESGEKELLKSPSDHRLIYYQSVFQ